MCFDRLRAVWQVPAAGNQLTCDNIAAMDEEFHIALTQAAGNQELTSILVNVTNRIRIMRRLDFKYERRIAQTYQEHAGLLDVIERQDEARAVELISLHIIDAYNGARTITLHRLQQVRAK